MVNGSVSRILYIGALVLIAICVIGKFILAGIHEETPGDVTAIMMGLLSFLFGTHVTPLLRSEQIATTLEKTLKDQTNSKAVRVSLVAKDE